MPITYNNPSIDNYEDLTALTAPDRRECVCPQSADGAECLWVDDIRDFRLNESCLHCSQIDEYAPCPGDTTIED